MLFQGRHVPHPASSPTILAPEAHHALHSSLSVLSIFLFKEVRGHNRDRTDVSARLMVQGSQSVENLCL